MVKRVVLETSMGAIVLELYYECAAATSSIGLTLDSHAPRTCENFATLAQRGLYSKTTFHRLVPGFIIQGGDPTGSGRGGQSIWGRPFEDEINDELKFVGAGILASANSGPNTNTSQFFITLAPTPSLNRRHTIFGRVYSVRLAQLESADRQGMRVVERLAAVAVDGEDRPREVLRIDKSRIIDDEVDETDLALA